uniref:Uncharacterized protein n=1 Tax=Anguilla anguilla TaxID=7936 RepID=A0A0E9TU62_ANGAN
MQPIFCRAAAVSYWPRSPLFRVSGNMNAIIQLISLFMK